MYENNGNNLCEKKSFVNIMFFLTTDNQDLSKDIIGHKENILIFRCTFRIQSGRRSSVINLIFFQDVLLCFWNVFVAIFFLCILACIEFSKEMAINFFIFQFLDFRLDYLA